MASPTGNDGLYSGARVGRPLHLVDPAAAAAIAALPLFGGTEAEPVAGDVLSFGEHLHLLGHTEDDYLAICYEIKSRGVKWTATVIKGVSAAVKYVDSLPTEADVYCGVNSLRAGLPPGVKGTAADVIDLVALWSDLDADEGKCGDLATADAIIDDLSAYLGTRPADIVHTGHGLHPYWPLDPGDTTQLSPADAETLLGCWGQFVSSVASHHGVAKVDNVFNLDRVLRAPGTVNNKNPDHPIGVTACADEGKPLSIAAIRKALDEFGIGEPPVASTNGSKGVAGEHYSRKCLVSRMRKATAGRRNKTLFGAAKDAARQGDLDDALEAQLIDAALATGLGADEINATIGSAAKTGQGAQSDSAEADDDLSEPIPLITRVAVPPFPVDALPKVIADMVTAVAEATQTDPAMPGVCAISALSACAGGHAEIEVRPGWREVLCTFIVNIAEPGERKSSVQADMTGGIVKLFENGWGAVVVGDSEAVMCWLAVGFHAAAAAVISSQTSKRSAISLRHWGALTR